MLRILHAIATLNPSAGGPREGVRQISRINESFGHTPEILTLDDPASPWLSNSDFKVHALGPPMTVYGYCRRLESWVRENRDNYDVVIINGLWRYNSYGVWRGLRGSKVPYYVYTHGMLDPWFKYRYPWKHAKKWLVWPWSEYRVLRDAQGVFFTCEEERLLARKTFWLYDCNEIVVNYGTPGVPIPSKDYGEIFLNKYPELRNYRRFVFLGRVHPKKGADIIIRTLARMKAKGSWSEAEMRLVIAGPSDGDYAESLQRLARKLGVDRSILWTGLVQGDEKWGALQCAEAFLLPSHQENFGIAVAESLSVSVPVLISHSVNIWAEIVADGAGLASSDTVDGCTQLLEKWLALPEVQRSQMRANAYACFRSRYTSKRAAVSMLSNIYQVMRAQKVLAARGLHNV